MQRFTRRVRKVFAYMCENRTTGSPFQVEVMTYTVSTVWLRID